MGTVIKFPRVRGPGRIRRREAPERPAGASAEIIILPVVRIERVLEAPSGIKAKAAKSAAGRSVAARAAKPAANKPAANKPAAKPAAKSAPANVGTGRKRRKRMAPDLPAPACGRG
jgi:hypothetical protein